VFAFKSSPIYFCKCGNLAPQRNLHDLQFVCGYLHVPLMPNSTNEMSPCDLIVCYHRRDSLCNYCTIFRLSTVRLRKIPVARRAATCWTDVSNTNTDRRPYDLRSRKKKNMMKIGDQACHFLINRRVSFKCSIVDIWSDILSAVKLYKSFNQLDNMYTLERGISFQFVVACCYVLFFSNIVYVSVCVLYEFLILSYIRLQ